MLGPAESEQAHYLRTMGFLRLTQEQADRITRAVKILLPNQGALSQLLSGRIIPLFVHINNMTIARDGLGMLWSINKKMILEEAVFNDLTPYVPQLLGVR